MTIRESIQSVWATANASSADDYFKSSSGTKNLYLPEQDQVIITLAEIHTLVLEAAQD